VWGHSAGGAAALLAQHLAQHRREQADALVVSGTFTSLVDVATRIATAPLWRQRLSTRAQTLLNAFVGERVARLVANVVVHAMWLTAGRHATLTTPFEAAQLLSTQQQQQQQQQHTLFIHGSDDALVHVDNAHRFASLGYTTCIVPRGGHNLRELLRLGASSVGPSLHALLQLMHHHHHDHHQQQHIIV
jgi:pimeloyl-ACP methyl ester carboxylesterase